MSELVAGHTGAGERCWFCVWEGGWIRGPGSLNVALDASWDERAEIQRQWEAAWQLPFPREALTEPCVRLPGRKYFLLEGPLDAVREIGAWTHWQGRSRFTPESPNLWWPDDRTWCVATEIDLHSTHVGGSAALIDEIVGDARFESLEVHGSDLCGDRVNRSS